jgi:hypothetical protein
MAKPITGKTHVGERREKRPNGDIYVYERITAYNEKTRKAYTVSQKLKGKIKAGTQKIVSTRPKKRKGEGRIAKCHPSTYRPHGHPGMGWQGFRYR